MIDIYDKQMTYLDTIENPVEMSYNTPENKLWTGRLILPLDHPSVQYCQLFNRVRLYRKNGEEVGLFRIMKSKISKKGERTVAYQLEHVLGLLIDPSIPGYHQTDNQTTRYNIEYLLGWQKQQDWVVGQVDFDFKYSYYWQNENGVYNALGSITEPFNVPYQWTWDTSIYPFKLNLIKPSTEPKARIRAGYNMEGIDKEEDGHKVVTRIRPLGYSEGVNQLTVASVNGGDEWLTAEQTYIDQFGEVEWNPVDKKIRDAESLKAWGQKLLDEYKKTPVTYKVDAAEVYVKTGLPIDKFETGDIVEVTDPDLGTFNARVKNAPKPDATGKPWQTSLELERRVKDIGDSLNELRERDRIHSVYAQGAVNFDSQSFDQACDTQNPAVIRFWVDEDAVKVNKVAISYETREFEGYLRGMESAGQTTVTSEGGGSIIKSTAAGGSTTVTSASGGASTQTSSNGGGVSKSTASGGASVQTTEYKLYQDLTRATSAPVNANSVSFQEHYHNFNINAATYSHDHSVSIPDHSHSFSVPDHSHSVSIPSHTHNVSIPDHSHQINLPDHTHKVNIPGHTHPVKYGIYKGPKPTSITVKVDGNIVSGAGLNENNFDLVPFLTRDGSGNVQRGTFHTIEVSPNDLGRIRGNIITKQFIESKGEYTV